MSITIFIIYCYIVTIKILSNVQLLSVLIFKDINMDNARKLASKYDFSGGQIDNIAHKRIIGYILSGKVTTLNELKYCQSELLDNKCGRKQIAGFSV